LFCLLSPEAYLLAGKHSFILSLSFLSSFQILLFPPQAKRGATSAAMSG
jgi:hypothetical protein